MTPMPQDPDGDSTELLPDAAVQALIKFAYDQSEADLIEDEESLIKDSGLPKDFDILYRIKSGGMGVVYKANHRKLDRVVALKMVHSLQQDHERANARFHQEAKLLARLNHPNVVQVFGFHPCGESGCIEMAFVDGRDFREWIHECSPDWKCLASVLCKIARGCGYLHANNIVHRDVKPENVLVCNGSDDPILIDLGIAKEQKTTLTLTNEVVGTPQYMAPEQVFTNGDTVSPAADVYSIGVMTYEALTGRLPYGELEAEMRRRRELEIAPLKPRNIISDIPKDLENICLKSLNHRAHERYANGDMLADDLERFLHDEPVTARPLGGCIRLWRRVTKRPATAIAAILAFLAAGSAFWFQSHAQTEQEIGRLLQKINKDLRVQQWHPDHLRRLEHDIERITQLDLEKGNALYDEMIKAAQETVGRRISTAKLRDHDVDQINDFLSCWSTRDKTSADRLKAQLQGRLSRWETSFNLVSPFVSLTECFANTQAKIADGILFPLHGEKPPHSPRVIIKPRINRPVKFDVVFTPPSGGVSRIGLTIGLQGSRYNFRLMSLREVPIAARQYVEGNPTSEATPVLAVFHEDQLLRAKELKVMDILHKEVTLSALVDETSLVCCANDSFSLEASDCFAHSLLGLPFEIGIEWPSDTGVVSMEVNTRGLASKPSPLEKADAYYRAKQWSRAKAEYQSIIGDALYDQEVRYKIGCTELASGADESAIHTLNELGIKGGTPWKELACVKLWQYYAQHGNLAEANDWMDTLPPIEQLPRFVKASISSAERAKILKSYQATSRGVSVLGRNTSVIERGVRVHQILGISPTEIAVKFGLGLHFHGDDARALDIFRSGIDARLLPDGQYISQRTLLLCLDNWFWVPMPQNDRRRLDAISVWRRDYAQSGVAWMAPLLLEDSRILARKGDWLGAAAIAKKVRLEPKTDYRLRIAACTLEGYSLSQTSSVSPTSAGDAWNEALRLCRDHAGEATSMTLCNELILLNAARRWNAPAASRILSGLVFQGTNSSEQSRFLSRFFSADTFAELMNKNVDTAEGAELMKNYILRERSASELVLELGIQIFCATICGDAFVANEQTSNRPAVRVVVSDVISDFKAGRFNGPVDLFLLLRFWHSPPSNPVMLALLKVNMGRWSAASRCGLCWLLAERSSMLGDQKAAQALMSEINQDDLAPIVRSQLERKISAKQ